MARPMAITPTYASGDLARILEIEQRQIEETVADLTDEQFTWRPTPTAKSALDILWHVAYGAEPTKPATKAEALAALRAHHAEVQQEIANPGRLDEEVTWWTGDRITFRGVVWGQIGIGPTTWES